MRRRKGILTVFYVARIFGRTTALGRETMEGDMEQEAELREAVWNAHDCLHDFHKDGTVTIGAMASVLKDLIQAAERFLEAKS